MLGISAGFGTTISAGTLQVGAGGTAGTLGTGSVVDNSALAFNRSDAITYAVFARQMEALRRQTETFKNRYIRLLNEAETRELSQPVFQATDVLIASAHTWKEQIRTEADIAALAANGPGAQLSRAEAAHDAALRQRASQWEVAYRLIAQAALAATR